MPSVVLQEGRAEGEVVHGRVEGRVRAWGAKDDTVENGGSEEGAIKEKCVRIRFRLGHGVAVGSARCRYFVQTLGRLGSEWWKRGDAENQVVEKHKDQVAYGRYLIPSGNLLLIEGTPKSVTSLSPANSKPWRSRLCSSEQTLPI